MNTHFRTRAEKILAMLPPPGSPDESENEEALEEDFFNIDELQDLDGDTLVNYAEAMLEDLHVMEGVEDPTPSVLNPSVENQPGPSSSTLSPPCPEHQKRPDKLRRVQKKTKQNLKPEKRTGKKLKLRWQWTNQEYKGVVSIPEDKFTASYDTPEEPIRYFQRFLTEEVLQLIVEQTNLYLTQKFGGVTPGAIKKHEILDFLCIQLYMSVVQMPAYTDYWAEKTRFGPVANTMPLKRYQFVRKYLHFANNMDSDEDRYFKVRNIFEMIRRNFSKVPGTYRQSVDEMTVPYKGNKAGSRKQYNPKKPKKWGFKIFARSGVDGFVHDMLLYDSNNTFSGINLSLTDKAFSFVGKVVISICKTIPNPALHALHFDNWYSSLDLMVYLRNEYGILTLGTVRENRLHGLKLTPDKILGKKGRGAHENKVDNKNKISVTKWMDNKSVVLATTYVSSNVSKIKRWCRLTKKKIEVPCPESVLEYNKFMGGVDLSDMLVALYRTKYRSHKWYLCLFSHLFDLCVNNAWILYKRDITIENEKRKLAQKEGNVSVLPTMRLKDFRVELAENLRFFGRSLTSGRSSKKLKKTLLVERPSSPCSASRYDQIGHFAEKDTRGRCKHCQKYTYIHCLKCKVRLCFVEDRNCFLHYHIKI